MTTRGMISEWFDRGVADGAKRERDEWIVKWDEHDHYPKGYVTAQIQLRERVQAELERVRAALERIARYGNDGICPFGCDTPYIAQQALGQHRQGME